LLGGSKVKKDAQRARRFSLPLSLRYRSAGASLWHDGRIENISRSGVLFWTEEPLDVDTPVEMRIALPLLRTSPGIVCRGRIVRTVLPSARHAPPGLAATISSYRFVRDDRGAA